MNPSFFYRCLTGNGDEMKLVLYKETAGVNLKAVRKEIPYRKYMILIILTLQGATHKLKNIRGMTSYIN